MKSLKGKPIHLSASEMKLIMLSLSEMSLKNLKGNSYTPEDFRELYVKMFDYVMSSEAHDKKEFLQSLK